MNKAKIKKRIVYSVLFMRDDSDVLRFRMRSFWLKSLIYFFILLLFVAGTASYLSVHYWNKSKNLESKIFTKEAELKPLQEQMGRLDRLNSFAKATDTEAPEELRPILQNIGSSNATSKLMTNATAQANSHLSNQTAATNSTALAGQLGQEQASLANGGNQTQVSSSVTPSSANPETPSFENTFLKVNNFSSRFAAKNKVKVSFELSNQAQGNVSGTVHISFVDINKNTIAVKPDKDNTNFKINFSKEFVLTFSMPEDLKNEDLNGFLLQIEDNEQKTIHVEAFAAPTAN